MYEETGFSGAPAAEDDLMLCRADPVKIAPNIYIQWLVVLPVNRVWYKFSRAASNRLDRFWLNPVVTLPLAKRPLPGMEVDITSW